MPRKRNFKKSADDDKRAKTGGTQSSAPAQLTRDVGTYSFAWPVGLPFDLICEGSDQNVTFGQYTVPGVCTLPFVPTIGVSKDRSSVVNMAVQKLFSTLTATNSRPTRYAEPDLARYLLAADSLYIMHNWLKRIYGILLAYNGENRYLPDTLLQCMGVSPASVKNSMSNVRYYINQLAQKINCIFVPNVLPLFLRHVNMTQNIYRDEEITKAQLYLFTPSHLYKYNELTTPAELTAVEWLSFNADGSPKITWTFTKIIEKCDELLNAMLYSEDVGIIGADLLRAFGMESMIRMEMIDEFYAVFPTDNKDVLWAIKNATIYDGVDIDSLKISEATEIETGGYITADPKFKAYAPIISKRLIGAGEDALPEDAMLQTCTWASIPETYTNITTGSYNDGGWCTFKQIGTEVLHSAFIAYYTWQQAGAAPSLQFVFAPRSVIKSNNTYFGSHLKELTAVDDFRYHPAVNVFSYASNSFVFVDTLWEITNYTVVDPQGLAKIHETALLNMFGVPSF